MWDKELIQKEVPTVTINEIDCQSCVLQPDNNKLIRCECTSIKDSNNSLNL